MRIDLRFQIRIETIADLQHQKNLEPKWNMNPNAVSNIGIGRNTPKDVDPEDGATTNIVEITGYLLKCFTTKIVKQIFGE
jgi:hypothetical protein